MPLYFPKIMSSIRSNSAKLKKYQFLELLYFQAGFVGEGIFKHDTYSLVFNNQYNILHTINIRLFIYKLYRCTTVLIY